MDPINNIHKHYVDRIHPHRPSHEILDWAGADTHEARFQILAREIDLAGRSILDVGCGLGDLATFLGEQGIDVDYTGVDIIEKMIAEARRRRPDATFVCGDMFGPEPLWPERAFDVVFCSGTLNLNLGNNRQFIARALPRMLSHAREALVVNMLHHRAGCPDPTYYHYDPADAERILRPLCKELRRVEDYLPNDFTLVARPGE